FSRTSTRKCRGTCASSATGSSPPAAPKASPKASSPSSVAASERSYSFTTGVPQGRFDDLMALLRSAWWSSARTSEDRRRLTAGPSLFFFAVEHPGGRLVAMARALSDGVYKAMVFDVIVLPELQGEGLGRKVMEMLLDHPAVRGAQHVELYCLP